MKKIICFLFGHNRKKITTKNTGVATFYYGCCSRCHKNQFILFQFNQ